MSKFPGQKGSNIHDAIANIHPEVILIQGSTLEDIVCKDGEKPPNVLDIDLTSTAIQDEIKRLDDGWDSEAWIRERIKEYPSMAELLVALYDDDDKAAIESTRAAVKAKWPKDNSGPK